MVLAVETGTRRAAVDLSRIWCEENPPAWFRLVDAARAHDYTLLEVIEDRYRLIREAAARAAFERQTTVAAVAQEWAAALRAARQLSTLSTGAQVAVSAPVYWK